MSEMVNKVQAQLDALDRQRELLAKDLQIAKLKDKLDQQQAKIIVLTKLVDKLQAQPVLRDDTEAFFGNPTLPVTHYDVTKPFDK